MTDVYPYQQAPHRPPVSSTGDDDIDAEIVHFVAFLAAYAEAHDVEAHPDLIHDILVELARTAVIDPIAHPEHLNGDTRANLKLSHRHMRDLRALFAHMGQFTGRRVTIFGSAREPAGSPIYTLVHETARALADDGYWVVNGGGPGALEAATNGAGDRAVQVAIALPFEPRDPDAPDDALVLDKFAIRKLGLVRGITALVVAPGGLGTLDELFEALTLMQTGKHPIMPVLLLEPEGSDFWTTFTALADQLVTREMMSASDGDLWRVVHSPAEVLAGIDAFYAAFHSYVRVDQRLDAASGMNTSWLVLRLQDGYALDADALAALGTEFDDILTDEPPVVTPPSDKELREIERGLADLAEVRTFDAAFARIYDEDVWDHLGPADERIARIEAAFGCPITDPADRILHERLAEFYRLPRIGFWCIDRRFSRLAAVVRRVNALARGSAAG